MPAERLPMEPIEVTFAFLKSVYQASDLKSSRSRMDVFCDRLVRAVTAPTLLRALEDLMRGLNTEAEKMPPVAVADMIAAAGGPDAPAILEWLRQHTKLAAMLAGVRDEALFREALAGIVLPTVATSDEPGAAPAAGRFDIALTARCLSPLAHGADGKAGNSTLFRRQQVLLTNGQIVQLPYYAGNAIRGQMRDLLADHFLATLEIKPALWFFYALYSGGALEEAATSTKALAKQLGDNGSLRTDGLRGFRLKVVPLSLLGCALGNRVLPGRIQVAELRPVCAEWGTGPVPAASLLGWEYITRREDDESHKENHSMIANTEVLKAGTELRGGIMTDHGSNEIERGCLGRALVMLREHGQLGANNRHGLGRAEIAIDKCPDPAPYDAHLKEHRQEIVDYLESIGAIDKPGTGEAPTATLQRGAGTTEKQEDLF